MSHVGEPPDRWGPESTEAFDGRRLELSDELTAGLRVLALFAEQSPPVDMWPSQPEYGQPPAGLRPSNALAALSAATAAVQSVMPPCPYAPPGAPVGPRFLPPDNKLVLRCGHLNPAHCWDDYGHTPYEC